MIVRRMALRLAYEVEIGIAFLSLGAVTIGQ